MKLKDLFYSQILEEGGMACHIRCYTGGADTKEHLLSLARGELSVRTHVKEPLLQVREEYTSKSHENI
jgi:hypothetical protein